ncbi:MAG: chemotaxis protein, partial [Arcobacter sp.]
MLFSSRNDINSIIGTLDYLEKYIKDDINDVKFKSRVQDKNLKKIEDKILSIASYIQTQKNQDLKVYGEIMLVCERLSDGFSDDEVTEVSSDAKINYIAKT